MSNENESQFFTKVKNALKQAVSAVVGFYKEKTKIAVAVTAAVLVLAIGIPVLAGAIGGKNAKGGETAGATVSGEEWKAAFKAAFAFAGGSPTEGEGENEGELDLAGAFGRNMTSVATSKINGTEQEEVILKFDGNMIEIYGYGESYYMLFDNGKLYIATAMDGEVMGFEEDDIYGASWEQIFAVDQRINAKFLSEFSEYFEYKDGKYRIKSDKKAEAGEKYKTAYLEMLTEFGGFLNGTQLQIIINEYTVTFENKKIKEIYIDISRSYQGGGGSARVVQTVKDIGTTKITLPDEIKLPSAGGETAGNPVSAAFEEEWKAAFEEAFGQAGGSSTEGEGENEGELDLAGTLFGGNRTVATTAEVDGEKREGIQKYDGNMIEDDGGIFPGAVTYLLLDNGKFYIAAARDGEVIGFKEVDISYASSFEQIFAISQQVDAKFTSGLSECFEYKDGKYRIKSDKKAEAGEKYKTAYLEMLTEFGGFLNGTQLQIIINEYTVTFENKKIKEIYMDIVAVFDGDITGQRFTQTIKDIGTTKITLPDGIKLPSAE